MKSEINGIKMKLKRGANRGSLIKLQKMIFRNVDYKRGGKKYVKDECREIEAGERNKG